LLFVRGKSLQYATNSPRLGVLLSCWDELQESEQNLAPFTVLEQRSPLLASFIRANWVEGEHQVWGLSSTERKLPEDKPDAEFARKGPQHFGYCVLGPKERNPDLTIPVGWLAKAC
jgi:hypothetical protein